MNERTNGMILATLPGYAGGECWIVATGLTRASSNRKTGDGVQIWSLPTAGIIGAQSDACGSCPLMPITEGGQGGCYVTKLFLTATWRACADGRYPAWDGDVAPFERLFVRFGAWGDPCLLPLPLVERIATNCRGWTGYTHEWRRPEYQPFRRFFMASIHTNDEAFEASSMGWRWFGSPFNNENLLGAIQCPHQTNGTQCRDCKLCDGTGHGKRANVWNAPHGGIGRADQFTRSIQ